jgi:predicted PurR-regulated permease PerM
MNKEFVKILTYLGGLRFWIIAASVIIVIAGIKQSSYLVNIVLLSMFITSISLAPLHWLQKKGIPGTLATIMVILGLVLVASSTLVVIGGSADNFIEKLPFYEQRFNTLWNTTHDWLASYGIIEEDFKPMAELNPANLFSMMGSAFAGFGNVAAASLLIFIIFIFMIFEAGTFGRKMKLVSPESTEFSDNIISKLRKYFGIKFITSLATGVLIGIALFILGIDFPVLWGFLAFVLNFIPSVGSFIAAIPAVLLAFVQLSPFGALITAIIYFVINTIIGNVVEPQLMGKNLGISPLIVFISMLFWGYILGPIGMLIATPLMIAIKIIFDSRPVTRGMGIFLSDEKEIQHLEENQEQK